MLFKNSWKLSINLFDLKISLQGMTRGSFNKHILQSHRFQYNTDIRHEPCLDTLNLTLQASMYMMLSLLHKHYLCLASRLIEHNIVHDLPVYLICPSVLSLVGEPLLCYTCGSSNRILIDYKWVRDLTVPMHLGLN